MKCCESANHIVQQIQTAKNEDAENFLSLNRKSFVFFVPELKCASCLWLVRKGLSEIDGIASIQTDLAEKSVTVRFADASLRPNLSRILENLKKLGYTALPPQKLGDVAAERELSRRRTKQVAIAGVAFANVMLLSAALYLAGGAKDFDPGLKQLFLWLSAAITLGSLWVTSRSLFRNAFSSLRFKKLHVDVPILFAMLVALSASLVNLLRKDGEVYFDSITGLLFFLLVGRTLHDILLERARKLTNAAPSALPARANSVKPNDLVTVAAGEVFPADGLVVSGASEVNEALLTGESLLVAKKTGDQVFAGTQNIFGAIDVRVTHAQTQTRLWQILKATEQAAQNKAIYQGLIDKILPWFVVATLLLAGLGFSLWYQTDMVFAAKVCVSVLIVCCPCALALSMPLASTFYLRRAWMHGVLIKNPDTLERLAKVDTIVIDKTRTLTTGDMLVTEMFGTLSDELASKLFALTKKSRHPVSVAINAYLKHQVPSSDIKLIKEFPGKGLAGTNENETAYCYLGKANWVASQLPSSSLISLDFFAQLSQHEDCVFASDGKSACAFALSDPIKPEAADLVSNWQAAGLPVYLTSGDTKQRVYHISHILNLTDEHVHANLTPEEKMWFVKKLQKQGRKILFVGDGMNDAAAASQADVSVAVGGSIDLAILSSDVALEGADIARIENLRQFAKYSVSTLKSLLLISGLYNFIAVGFALSGILHPLVAALIMPAASISVLLLSLLRKGDYLWTSSLSSCPYPSPLPAEQPLYFGEPQTKGSGTI